MEDEGKERKNIYIRHNFSSYKNVSDVKRKRTRDSMKKKKERIINNKGRGEGKSGKRMKFSPLSSQKKMS